MQNSLLAFVRNTVEQLSLDGEGHEGLLSVLDFLRGQLDEIYARFEPPAPAGAEPIREAMLESVDLFCSAFDCLEHYVSQPNPKLLTLAIQVAEEANDLLEQVDFSITESQQSITHLSQV